MHLLLQLIPVFSMLLLMTSAAGSALWASDLERERQPPEQMAADEPATDDPPAYTEYSDDPV